jgi:hypothetical protein
MKKLFWTVLLLAGCGQGLGDRCQVNDDCSSPYVCNQAKMECQATTTGGIDATVPDAPKVPVIDAGTDAPMVDAMIDATVADAATD